MTIFVTGDDSIRFTRRAVGRHRNLPLGTLCVAHRTAQLNDFQRAALKVLRQHRQIDCTKARADAEVCAKRDHRVKNSLQSGAFDRNPDPKRKSPEARASLDTIRASFYH